MKIQRIIENLEKVFSVILVLFTIAMFVIVFFNVFMRFIMNNSIGWADELSRFIFVWISFLGAVLAYKADEHVGLSFIVDKIKSFRVKKIIMIIQNLIALTVLFILTFYGYKVSIMAKNVSSALSRPMSTL
jgi:TRAP-type C4-dicarboxylate transport system permease small subunit